MNSNRHRQGVYCPDCTCPDCNHYREALALGRNAELAACRVTRIVPNRPLIRPDHNLPHLRLSSRGKREALKGRNSRLVTLKFSLRYLGLDHNYKQIVELTLPANAMLIVKDDHEAHGLDLEKLLELCRYEKQRRT